jgi:iron complex transport system substrate-binding protein
MAFLRSVPGGAFLALTLCVLTGTSAMAEPIHIDQKRGTLERAARNAPMAVDSAVNKRGFARGGLDLMVAYGRQSVAHANPVPDPIRDRICASPMWQFIDFTRNNCGSGLPVVRIYGGGLSALRLAKLPNARIENGPPQ